MKFLSAQRFEYLIILTLVMLFSPNSIKAQVTIGAGIAPQQGALLDIKQYDAQDNGVTATKGIGMPRVFLTSKTNLYPMFEATDQNYQGEQKQSMDNIHIGLLVFNMNKSEEEQLEIGLNVWNGKQWSLLGIGSLSELGMPGDEVGKVQGVSGTWYKTRRFGDAGEWMIENLRETEYDDQTQNEGFPVENRLRRIHEGVNNKAADFSWLDENHRETYAFYYYPDGNKALYEAHRDYGLLYTYSAATLGMAADRFELDSEFRPSTVQGICPTGWVVPGDWDWSKLREEIQNNLTKYTTNTNPQHTGASIKSPKKVVVPDNQHYNIENTDGESKTYGFNVLLVGGIMYDTDLGKNGPVGYGKIATFWSSTLNTDSWVLNRHVSYDNKQSENQYHASGDMYSVRCKKLERD